MEIDEDCEVPDWFFNQIEEKSTISAKKTDSDENENAIQFTPELIVKRVYSLGRILSSVFEEYNCHYWTSGGTTLGKIEYTYLLVYQSNLEMKNNSTLKIYKHYLPENFFFQALFDTKV